VVDCPDVWPWCAVRWTGKDIVANLFQSPLDRAGMRGLRCRQRCCDAVAFWVPYRLLWHRRHCGRYACSYHRAQAALQVG
jgi:hypothetical protein